MINIFDYAKKQMDKKRVNDLLMDIQKNSNEKLFIMLYDRELHNALFEKYGKYSEYDMKLHNDILELSSILEKYLK